MSKMTRTICTSLAHLAAAAATPAALAAQQGVARLVEVKGNVLVSTDHTIASAGEALRLAPGMRVLATLNSNATIEYEDGCRVIVQPGERAEVLTRGPCQSRKLQPVTYAPVLGVRP